MTVLESIYNRNVAQGAQGAQNTPAVTQEVAAPVTTQVVAPVQGTTSTATTSPVAQEVATPTSVSQLSTPITVQPATTAAPAQPTPNKWGYDDAEMEWLNKSGITPEMLERTVGEFNPANYGTQQRQWYEATVTKPTIPDEKRIRNARIAASIGDALGSIVEIAAVNRGALAKGRRYEDSALGKTERKQKELQDIYQQQTARYESGLYDAGMRDILRGLDQHRQERAAIGNVIGTKRKLDQDKAQFETTMQQREAEARQRQQNEEADRAERKRVNDANIARGKAMTAQGWANVKNSKDRVDAYVRNLGTKGKDAGYQIAFTPNPNDDNVQRDSFGEPIKFVNIPQAEANKLIVDALSDTDFLKENPQYNRVDLAGEAGRSLTTAERQDIAVRYYQHIYDRTWAERDTQSERPQTGAPAFSGYPYSPYGYYDPSWLYSADDPDDFDNRYL